MKTGPSQTLPPDKEPKAKGLFQDISAAGTATVRVEPGAKSQEPRARRQTRGFVLIIIVGMLAVMVVLGLSFAEQGRIELMGAGNTRDLDAADALAETGFQFALRALKDDRNVWSNANPGWLAKHNGGAGWTSRWGFNPYYDQFDSAGGVKTPLRRGSDTLNDMGPAPSHDVASDTSRARNFLDTWQMLFWNEEAKGSTYQAYGYKFLFDLKYKGDPEENNKTVFQRQPPDPGSLTDTWPLQPLARVKKFRVRIGTGNALIQVSIAPLDGGFNLNDVFDPGTANERPGIYETLRKGWPDYAGADLNPNDARVPYASPDRRTLEYLLGRPPVWAVRQYEWASYRWGDRRYDPPLQVVANQPEGNRRWDTGVYNFRRIVWPFGRSGKYAATRTKSGSMGTYPWYQIGRLTNLFDNEPTLFYNSDAQAWWRFNYEHPRYAMWVTTQGMSLRQDWGLKNGSDTKMTGGTGWFYQWYPSGRYRTDPRVNPRAWRGTSETYADLRFMGFGFDLQNPKRGGTATSYSSSQGLFYTSFYEGAGVYGFPKARAFQRHFLPAVARGRFWSNLMADWYFGGAPGYTSMLGVHGGTGNESFNNWANLGSTYDSLGLGTHWQPPTQHVWMPGKWNNGKLSTREKDMGLKGYPAALPPTKPAISYAYPMPKWGDDKKLGNAHWTYMNNRISIRAFGIQENWGLNGKDDTKGRFYDAVCINTTNFQVAYGLLSPQQIPSMLNRTIVAPHLHWKARFLDCELRLRDPTRDFDERTNPWMPVVMTLMSTKDMGATVPPLGDPKREWDPDPASPNFNPWRPVRMELKDPNKAWNPDDASPEYNPWVKPELVDPGKAYNPDPSHPDYNPFKYDDALDASTDYEKNPWMLSVKFPFYDMTKGFDPAAPEKNPIAIAQIVDDRLNYKNDKGGKDKYSRLIPFLDGNNQDIKKQYDDFKAAFSIDNTVGSESYDYDPTKLAEPLMAGTAPTPAKDALPTDPKQPASVGYQGYKFVARRYNMRTLMDDKEKASGGGKKLDFSDKPDDLSKELEDATKKKTFLGRLSYHRHVDPLRPGVIWGKMDFYTPEPKDYTDVYGQDFEGSGAVQDDVFPDTHYDMRLMWRYRTSTGNSNDYNIRKSLTPARPDNVVNYADWWRQRYRLFPPKVDKDNSGAGFKPASAKGPGGKLRYPEGKVPSLVDLGGGKARTLNVNTSRALGARPHPLYGLPNPDYLQMFPGSSANFYWADQFRRYFPVVAVSGGQPGRAKGNAMAPLSRAKLVEDDATPVDPYLPVAKDRANYNPNIGDAEVKHLVDSHFVPGIGKDEAWRITRIGQKYQEIIANEIMDYQVNPWWPNPVMQQDEIGVPMTKYVFRSTGGKGGDNQGQRNTQFHPGGAQFGLSAGMKFPIWHSFADHVGRVGSGFSDSIQYPVPEFYAYYNRFWVRPGHERFRYTGGGALDEYANFAAGEAYRYKPDAALSLAPNPVAKRGVYPQPFQYFGQDYYDTGAEAARFTDAVKDFPTNTLEDQLGSDYRYWTIAARAMNETNMRKAPMRNHPFKNWADFVAFLGHLVYRSPIPPEPVGGLPFLRDPVFGVNAWRVCHDNRPNVDPRNREQFFDGSKIAEGGNLGPGQGNSWRDQAFPDALMGFIPGRRLWKESIVAIDGYWPISANYGAAPESMNAGGNTVKPDGTALAKTDPEAYRYPQFPPSSPWSAGAGADVRIKEWKRRIDEWRGRDAAGLRVEHQYISERAANDVLVSLSNGRIGPIDFDGDGHVTMTRKEEIPPSPDDPTLEGNWNYPNDSGYLWRLRPHGYPWHKLSGLDPNSVVEYEDIEVANSDIYKLDNLAYGIKKKATASSWKKAPMEDYIQGCVTLPIKFRANTFRVTVVVEQTDEKFQDVLSVRRYTRVYSRVPGKPASPKVQGPYTGEFIQHNTRALSGSVDPIMSWLGVSSGP